MANPPFVFPSDGKGNLVEDTGYSQVLVITGGDRAVNGPGCMIQVLQAGTAQPGYLSAADWNTFNSKQPAGDYLTLSGGTMSGNLAMGGHKVTGLAAAANNGEAVRFDEFNMHSHSHSSLSNLTADDHPQYLPADGSRPITNPTTIAQSYAGIINLLCLQNPAVGTGYGAGLVFTSEATHILGHPVDVACIQGICTETVYGDGKLLFLVANAGSLITAAWFNKDGQLAMNSHKITGLAAAAAAGDAVRYDEWIAAQDPGHKHSQIWNTSGGAVALSASSAGKIAIGGSTTGRWLEVYGDIRCVGLFNYKNTAPADGDLVAGECGLWLDPTPGAAKLMIKAKNIGGTVVTGSVALS